MKIENLNQLKEWVKVFFLPKQESSCVFLLEGPMGAGKTQIVRFLGEILMWKDVSSPTYSIINEYGNGEIHHCDLYRIEDLEDLEQTGFWELFQKKSGWIFVEWPSRMNIARIPKGWDIYHIKVSHVQIDVEFMNN